MIDDAMRVRTVRAMSDIRTIDPVRTYVSALAATRDIEAPYGAVVFTMLTTMMRLHELVRPTTVFAAGRATIAEAHPSEGPAHGRAVPVSRLTTQLLSPGGGPVSELLGIQPEALPRLGDSLRLHLLDHEELVGLASPEQAWLTALNGVLAAATTPSDRTAVLMYAGVHARGRRATSRRNRLSYDDLQCVANLVDQLASEAGFAHSTHAEYADGGQPEVAAAGPNGPRLARTSGTARRLRQSPPPA